MEGSNRFKLNSADVKKILVGLGVALAGAALTYFSSVITQIDFGSWTPVVVAGFSVVANVIRKWVSENGGDNVR